MIDLQIVRKEFLKKLFILMEYFDKIKKDINEIYRVKITNEKTTAYKYVSFYYQKEIDEFDDKELKYSIKENTIEFIKISTEIVDKIYSCIYSLFNTKHQSDYIKNSDDPDEILEKINNNL